MVLYPESENKNPTDKKNIISLVWLKNSGFNKIQHNYKLRPIHWTLSIQNHLRYKNKFKWFQKRLDMNVRFPLEIIFFTVIEIIQKILTKKTSDVQYIAEK